MSVRHLFIALLFLNLSGELSAVLWEQSVCDPDPEPSMPEGVVRDIGRFPWLGLIQYTFVVGNEWKFVVTTAVLIHPTFVIASAADIAMIPHDLLRNNTKFVVWDTRNEKHVLDVKDYSLHPEYSDGTTRSSVAILEIFPSGVIGFANVKNPLLPVCLNLKGVVQLTDLYAIEMTDGQGEFQKKVYKMKYVSDDDCDGFYNKAGLGDPLMRPSRYVCAASELQRDPCVWDAGVALVSRQAWGYWKLIGFGSRGAGCGAPARFIFIPSNLQWFDEVIAIGDVIEEQQEDETVKLYFRRLSPVKFAMMKGDTRIPTTQGQCDKKFRGSMVFKDGSELLVNKNFVQGFYFVSVAMFDELTCAIVSLESLKRSNAAVWVEHHCYREISGLDPTSRNGPDFRKLECFMYFKSKAFLEIRFYFSFRAVIEISMYGNPGSQWAANPFETTWHTEPWVATQSIKLRNDGWFLHSMWFWQTW